jgi:16S rRNA (cytosine967-C5)-methyltransferase
MMVSEGRFLMTLEQVATQVVSKYLKKGNMARCLRDILPSSMLPKEKRETVAEIVHSVVRWKKLYDHILDTRATEPTPRLYVQLAIEGAEAGASSFPFEYRYSCSAYVAGVLRDHTDWAGYLNETPPTTLCVNLNKSSPQQVMTQLHEEQIFAERSVLDTAILTSSVSKYSTMLQQRFAHVQDESSQLVAYLAASYGESIFDFCAGSGGKSLTMASLHRNTKHLFAYDTNAAKRTTLTKRCDEYGARVKVEQTIPVKTFDVVLVDAPCTGLGAARRNPEAKYVENADEFPSTQLSILRQAAENVRGQGYLVYSVCTITPEETTDVIQQFVGHTDFSLAPFTSTLTPWLQPTKQGAFTVLPRGDLFFVAVLHRQ